MGETVAIDLAAALGGTAATDEGAGYGPQIRFGDDDGKWRSGVTPLLEYGLLKVHGADSATFLQSQLTSDVAALGNGEARLAGYCSAKGRMMASFWVWRDVAQQTFWLACSRDIAVALARRLSMFVLRAKAKVENVSDAVTLVGLIGLKDEPLADQLSVWMAAAAAEDQTAPPDGGFGAGRVRLPPVILGAPLMSVLYPDSSVALSRPLQIERAVQAVPATMLAQTLRQAGAAGARLLPTQVWRRLEVLSGVARINARNQELFVPQMINFELVDGVSFTKGCYPGQEVVARSQYLGKLKRRMFLGLGRGAVPPPGVDVNAVPPPGVDVSAGGGSAEPVGQVVLAAGLDDDDRFVVLFESRTAAVPGAGESPETGLRVGSCMLLRLPLPYGLPSSGKPDAA